jgi:hypothetical protein
MRESGGSLQVFLDAAAQPSIIDYNTTMLRVAALHKQLSDRRLTSVNVASDGNCFYRALSLILHGSEDHHAELRRLVADHLSLNYVHVFNIMPTDYTSVEQCIQCMRQNGVWVGEEAIVAAADFLQRELHIFKFVSSAGTSPSVYTPASGSCLGPPLGLAFFEPGHFHAVFNDATSGGPFNTPSQLSRAPLNA